MAAVHILEFKKKIQFWPRNCQRVTNLLLCTKFHRNRNIFVEILRFHDFQDGECPPSWILWVQQEIRSVELGVCPMQLFLFLITWRSSCSKSAAVYKISSKSDDFSLRYGDITIFKMAAVRHLEFWTHQSIHNTCLVCCGHTGEFIFCPCIALYRQ